MSSRGLSRRYIASMNSPSRSQDRFLGVNDDKSQHTPLRGRVLDWAWNHPRWKRRMREMWGVGREAAGLVGLPKPFDPPEWKALRQIAASASAPAADAERVLFMSWRGWSTHLAIETVLAMPYSGAGERRSLRTAAAASRSAMSCPLMRRPPCRATRAVNMRRDPFARRHSTASRSATFSTSLQQCVSRASVPGHRCDQGL